jgi:hypothetical protein
MKTVCQLNGDGYFVGPVVADESPLESGVFLIPGGAIDAPIPEIPDGKLAKWNGGSFDFVDPPKRDDTGNVIVDDGKIPPVSPRQIRQALTRAGLRSAVEGAIAGSNDQDMKDWYEYATAFERNNAAVVNLAVVIGVTDEQLDDLWRLAAVL